MYENLAAQVESGIIPPDESRGDWTGLHAAVATVIGGFLAGKHDGTVMLAAAADIFCLRYGNGRLLVHPKPIFYHLRHFDDSLTPAMIGRALSEMSIPASDKDARYTVSDGGRRSKVYSIHLPTFWAFLKKTQPGYPECVDDFKAYVNASKPKYL